MKKLRHVAEKLLQGFDRLPLSVRFLLAYILPVIAIIWMSVFRGIELYQTVDNIRQLKRNTNLAVEAGLLVGSVQLERGLSAIYLDGLNAVQVQKLEPARRETDKYLGSFQSTLSAPINQQQPSGFTLALSDIGQSLAKLPEIRQRIDSRQVSADDMLLYYTRHIERINGLIARLSGQADDAQIARKLNAYFILIRLKELLGKERVIISRALVTTKLTDQQLGTLHHLSGGQQNALIGFQSQINIADLARPLFFESAAKNFRDLLFSPTDRQPLMKGTSPEQWFNWQSERMRKIGPVENELIKNILTDTHNKLAAAQYELWRYVIISPLILLTALTLTFLIFRHIKARFQLTEAVFEHTNDSIIVTDARARIVEVNNAFSRITGYSRAEALGKNPSILKSGRQDHNSYKTFWRELKQNGTWQGELWNRRKNGEIYAELTTINAIRNRHGSTRYYVAVSFDTTDRAFEHQRQLEYRSYHDPLTGLPNQMLLRDRLEHALHLSKREEKQIILACVDLDHLKQINDQYGYAFGDEMLVLVSKRLRSLLRDSDSLARTGGDEFFLVIEALDAPDQASQVLERVKRELSEPFVLHGHSVALTASIGATVFPSDTGDADALIRHATQALHQSKHNGRACLSWYDSQNGHNQNLLSLLIRRLERAITSNELRLYYQPKVNMVTGELLGLEALLRWQDPVRGLVPPGEFLPRIEQHPFSIMIGNWVIETAISRIEQWKSAGIDVKVSVNVNALQLLDPGFTESLDACIRRHPGFDPGSLELEILESVAINDIGRAGEVLSECQNLGISVSLDDFGTGFSSLEYLKRLPADSLKIDQTFVRDMENDAGDRAIVRGIIGLATAFSFDVIAEGVETEDQGCTLITMGCINAQGFGIARPMPPEEFVSWMEVWEPPASWQVQ